jgi:hypothetical protein
MYIEFTGASGAGKSMLLERTLASVNQHDRITSNHEKRFDFAPLRQPTLQNAVLDLKAWQVLAAHGLLFREAAFAWKLTAPYKPSFLYRINIVRGYLRKRGVFEYCRTAYENDLVLMDEGIVHGMHNLLVHPDMPARVQDIDLYLHHIPLPDRIVLVHAPVAALEERILVRSDQPIRTRNIQTLAKYARHAWALYEIVKSHPLLQDRLILIETGNGGTPLSAENLARQLEGMLHA